MYRKLLYLLPLLITGFLQATAVDDPASRISEKIHIEHMTLREKIGQLCMAAAISNEEKNEEQLRYWSAWQPLYNIKTAYIEKLIKEYAIGGVVFFGRNTDPEDQVALTHRFQSLSQIPLFIALDAECGIASQLSRKTTLKYPYNMALGATQDSSLLYATGFEVGQQLQAIGVNINLAPVVDVNNNPDNPIIGVRSFGSDEKLVAKLGVAFMQGVQDAGIIACAKHFPGHGDTSQDSHYALPVISHPKERLENIELYPFQTMIQAGVKAIMIAHVQVPVLEPTEGLPSSLSYAISTQLLQKEMGFSGLVITDALGMKGVTNGFEPGELELKALLAGADILLCPLDIPKAIDTIERAVLRGSLSEDELNRKVLKVLEAKAWAFQHTGSQANNLTRLQTREAKELKKFLYSKTITIIHSTSPTPFVFPTDTTYVVTDNSQLNQFTDTLQAKKGFPHITYTFDSSTTPYLIGTVEKATHVIIGLSDKFPFKEKVAADCLERDIQCLCDSGKQVTVVLFCSPYQAVHVGAASTVMVAYDTDPDAQESAAQVLCGVQEATGILPVKVEIPGVSGHKK